LFNDDSSFDIRFGWDGVLAPSIHYSLQSSNYPTYYVRHSSFRARLDPSINQDLYHKDASWNIVPGNFRPAPPAPAPAPAPSPVPSAVRRCGKKAESGNWFDIGHRISFKSSNYPDRFLRHRNFEVWLDPKDGSDLYNKDSTFIVRPANNGKAGYVSFQSVNYPDRFIRHAGFLLWLHPSDGSALFKDDSSFLIEAALDRSINDHTLGSSNYPDHFIRHSSFRGRLDTSDNSDLFNHDSSWNIVPGNAPA